MGESGLTILRLGRPEAFLVPPIQSLVERACKAPLMFSAKGVLEHYGPLLGRPEVCVLVGRRGDDFVGLLVAEHWGAPFAPWPGVSHFYAEDRRFLSAAMPALRAWAEGERGHSGVLAFNLTGASDEAYRRWIAPAARGRVVGSALLFVWNSLEDAAACPSAQAEATASPEAPLSTSPPESTRSSAGSSPTSSRAGFWGMFAGLKARLSRSSRRKS